MIDADGTVTPVCITSDRPDVPRAILSKVDRLIPSPYRLLGGNWTDGAGRRLSLSEILELFPRAADAVPPKYRRGVDWGAFKELRVFFVETDRLRSGDSRPSYPVAEDYGVYSHDEAYLVASDRPATAVPRVKEYSRDILHRIQGVLASVLS